MLFYFILFKFPTYDDMQTNRYNGEPGGGGGGGGGGGVSGDGELHDPNDVQYDPVLTNSNNTDLVGPLVSAASALILIALGVMAGCYVKKWVTTTRLAWSE